VANNLWTAFIADNGSNEILVASLPEGGTWTPSVPINQTSPFTPSLALFNGKLYVAFITNDVDSATGVPSNRIFLCSTTDGVSWSDATFINHHSKCAPSLAVWNGKLHIAFIDNGSSDDIYVYGSPTPEDPGSWFELVATGQTSSRAPSLATFGPQTGDLYLAFTNGKTDDISVISIPVGGSWTAPTVTGHSCHFSPSLASFGGTLYLTFTGASSPKDLFLITLNANGTWSGDTALNQSTSATPCAVGFGSELSVGFIANSPSGEVLAVSSSSPSSSTGWASGNVDLQQQSPVGPSMAVAPFACCYQLVTYPGTLGGGAQYVFWSGLDSENRPIPVTGLVVEIQIDEALVVDATKGNPPGASIGFQINGLQATQVQIPGQPINWTPTIGDLTTGWVQYGIKMWPSPVMLTTWSQYWPPAVQQNSHVAANFTANLPNQNAIPMASYLNVPAWKIRFVFNYSNDGTGTITGFDCKVTDSSGNSVNSNMGINFLSYPQNQLTNGGPITLLNLSQLVAFQVVLVGFYDSANAFLDSGGGSITVQASTPLTVETTWSFPDTVGQGGTAENSNCTYGQLPSCPSKSFTQPFWVG
jgi:hypothetical protein